MGISLSEEQQQSHPIYKALRALFEQGTTALFESIEVNTCTNLFGIPSTHTSFYQEQGPSGSVIIGFVNLLLLLPTFFYSHSVNEYGPGFPSILGIEFTYGQGIRY